MSVLTLVIKFTSFDLILVSALFPPKAGSATELDHPTMCFVSGENGGRGSWIRMEGLDWGLTRREGETNCVRGNDPPIRLRRHW